MVNNSQDGPNRQATVVQGHTVPGFGPTFIANVDGHSSRLQVNQAHS